MSCSDVPHLSVDALLGGGDAAIAVGRHGITLLSVVILTFVRAGTRKGPPKRSWGDGFDAGNG